MNTPLPLTKFPLPCRSFSAFTMPLWRHKGMTMNNNQTSRKFNYYQTRHRKWSTDMTYITVMDNWNQSLCCSLMPSLKECSNSCSNSVGEKLTLSRGAGLNTVQSYNGCCSKKYDSGRCMKLKFLVRGKKKAYSQWEKLAFWHYL